MLCDIWMSCQKGYMCIYIYIYIYTCICIYVYIYICMYGSIVIKKRWISTPAPSGYILSACSSIRQLFGRHQLSFRGPSPRISCVCLDCAPVLFHGVRFRWGCPWGSSSSDVHVYLLFIFGVWFKSSRLWYYINASFVVLCSMVPGSRSESTTWVPRSICCV